MPYRFERYGAAASIDIMLITSRETKRWVIPKGNPIAGVEPHRAAAIEADEEAGIRGKVGSDPIGHYGYAKRLSDGAIQCIDVDVFPLAVTRELKSWKERRERDRRWFTRAEAADLVEEPELSDLIRGFDPVAADGRTAPQAPGLRSVIDWFRQLLS